MLKTLLRDMRLDAFSGQKCQQDCPQAPVGASVWLFLILSAKGSVAGANGLRRGMPVSSAN